MTALQYTISPNSITIELDDDGENVEYVDSSDHRFKRLQKALVEDMLNRALTLEDLDDLLDKHYRPEVERLKRLSGRVSYDSEADVLLFDNDPLDTTLANYIKELVQEDHPQLDAFVKFMEKLAANPSERSRNELFNWFKTLTDMGERMTIASNGNIVAYKGVVDDGNGTPVSRTSGPGIVDGVHYQNAQLPNRVGSTVEVSRSYVDDNETVGCSRGLHAGTYSYAHAFARGILLRVEIDPADVVSVPQDCAWQKIRACRYIVAEVIDAPETKPVVRGYYDAGWSDEDYEAWEEAGKDLRDAERYDEEGFSYEDALVAESEGGLGSIQEWMDLNFTLPEIIALKRAGVSYNDAALDNFDQDIIDSVRGYNADDEDDDDEEFCEDCGAELDYNWCEDCEDDDGDDEDSDSDYYGSRYLESEDEDDESDTLSDDEKREILKADLKKAQKAFKKLKDGKKGKKKSKKG